MASAEDTPEFFRGLNLNGPPLTIDGNAWDGQQASNYVCNDRAFENQSVKLVPATDHARAQMIRSSRWGGNRIEWTDIPPGVYSLFLYVWEDNDPETYTLAVNGRDVALNHVSGTQGQWQKLGPWYTSPVDGKIVLTSQGGAANFSGLELWRGQYDGIQEPMSSEQLAFFEQRIRPLLIDKCYACHSADADSMEGDLLVDSRATLRQGGMSGPAIVPGNLDKSLLIQAVRYSDDLQMPPDEPLSPEQILDLEHWVATGAADPRSTGTVYRGKTIDIEEAQEFWSLQPIQNPPVPEVSSDWPRTDIDRFILQAMRQQGLQPAADASKLTWIRRASYDLIGLPPTAEEIADYLADDSDMADERVINRLLDSPRYGERWGRHWLDVVRYADTAGDNSDYPIPQMHRYRDWVIQAFNRDLPYDEFVRDQLAGDLRGGNTEEQRQQRIIATGYLANARRFGSRVDDYPWHLTIEDTIDNLGRAYLGLSLSCARCHDHKFDPITARDYYGLYGIFASTRYPWPGIELDKRQRDFVPLVPSQELARVQEQLAERKQQQKKLDDEVQRLKDSLKNTPEDEKPAVRQQLQQAEQIAKEFASQAPLFETAYAVVEADHSQDAAVQLKGDPSKPGEVVPRHFPAVLHGQQLPADCQESGRRELAEWIVSPQNPLPARVMVNRIWHYHFGRGLVPTPNDFGKQGKPPTHPELLDYLAGRFRELNWSIKSMHREIMLSRVYRQSSDRDAKALAIDPANDWLAGFRRQRLDAESIRDTLLMIGGNLDLSPPGPHPFPPENEWGFTQHKPFKEIYDTNARSVYLMTQRIQRHPFLAIFDGADPSTSTASRSSSITPIQALYLLNDPFVHQQSERIVNRIWSTADTTDERLEVAHQTLFSRPITEDERSAAHDFLSRAQQMLRDEGNQAEPANRQAWQAYLRSLLRLNEFVYVD